MDSARLNELNSSPFGRKLHVLAHRLPRSCKAGADWELERGFHFTVLTEDFFELTLAARQRLEKVPTLPFFPEAKRAGQDRFLIWQCPGGYNPSRFSEFADLLAERDGTQYGLILSESAERLKATVDFPKYRGLWKSVEQPVLQVFQDFPDRDYFSVEKNLFHLGRIGRRLLKLGKIRRLMPW